MISVFIFIHNYKNFHERKKVKAKQTKAKSKRIFMLFELNHNFLS